VSGRMGGHLTHTGKAEVCSSFPISVSVSLHIPPPISHLWAALRGCGQAPPSCHTLPHQQQVLTERCWNSQALMMLVATLGKMPLFLFRLRSWSISSSSPPELGEATLVSSPSPDGGGHRHVPLVDSEEWGIRGSLNSHPRH
jgi:hypothetical protein